MKPNWARRPEDQLLGEARQVHHEDGRARGEFDREIAVRHGVERILRRPIETEQLGGVGPIDRIGGAGQRGGAERHHVHAPPTVGQALAVAIQHLEPGQHVMTEGDGLSDLQMGEAGHDGLGLALGEIQQGRLEGARWPRGSGRSPRAARAERRSRPDRCASARCAASCRHRRCCSVRADSTFMWTSSSGIDHSKAPASIRSRTASSPDDDGIALRVAQDALTGQHGGMGDRALDVVAIEPSVEVDRGGEGLDEGIGGRIEAPGPGLGGRAWLVHLRDPDWVDRRILHAGVPADGSCARHRVKADARSRTRDVGIRHNPDQDAHGLSL